MRINGSAGILKANLGKVFAHPVIRPDFRLWQLLVAKLLLPYVPKLRVSRLYPFSAEQGNWPDFRELDDEGRPHFMVAWCHGAPGIGLARLAGLAVIETPHVHEEIETAIAAMMNLTPGGRDHLCCGTLGCSDILLSFARRLARPELETRAQQQAAWTVRRARRQGYKLLDIDAADAFIPGMFQGLAGVGYALLRLAGSDELPSVLLWE